MGNLPWFMSCTFFIGLRRQNVGEVFTGMTRLGDIDGAEGAPLRLRRRRCRSGLCAMLFLLGFPSKRENRKFALVLNTR